MAGWFKRLFARHELIRTAEHHVLQYDLPPPDPEAARAQKERMHGQSHRLHVLQWRLDKTAREIEQDVDEPRPPLVHVRQGRPS